MASLIEYCFCAGWVWIRRNIQFLSPEHFTFCFCFPCNLIHWKHFWVLLSHSLSSRLAIAKQPAHKVQGWSAKCNAFPRLSLRYEVKGDWSWEGEAAVLGEGGGGGGSRCDFEQGSGKRRDFNSIRMEGKVMEAWALPHRINSTPAKRSQLSSNHTGLFWKRSSYYRVWSSGPPADFHSHNPLVNQEVPTLRSHLHFVCI